MAYYDNVVALSPLFYSRLNQTDGNFTDLGSGAVSITKADFTVGANQVTSRSGLDNAINGASGSPTLSHSTSGFAGTASFSISLWFRISNNPSALQYLAWYGSSTRYAYIRMETTGNLRCEVKGSGGTNTVTVATNYADNSWYHVLLSFNATSGVQTVYVNGTQVGQTTLSAGTVNTGGTMYWMRGQASATTNTWDGDFDEPALFTSALTSGNATTLSTVPVDGGYTAQAMSVSNVAMPDPTWSTQKQVSFSAEPMSVSNVVFVDPVVTTTSPQNINFAAEPMSVSNVVFVDPAVSAESPQFPVTVNAEPMAMSMATPDAGIQTDAIKTVAPMTMTMATRMAVVSSTPYDTHILNHSPALYLNMAGTQVQGSWSGSVSTSNTTLTGGIQGVGTEFTTGATYVFTKTGGDATLAVIEGWFKRTNSGTIVDMGGVKLNFSGSNLIINGLTVATSVDTNWHHFVIRQTGTQRGVWLDGVFVLDASADPAATSTFYVGNNKFGTDAFSGVIDAVVVYESDAPAEEHALYPAAPNDPSISVDAQPIEVNLEFVDPAITAITDVSVSADAITLDMLMVQPSVTNVTEVQVSAQPIQMTLIWPGVYNEAYDRYYNFIPQMLPGNYPTHAIWYKFNETAGAGVRDWLGGTGDTTSEPYFDGDGIYVGNVEYQILARGSRKAVGLRGGYVNPPDWSSYVTAAGIAAPTNSHTFELVFRTEDTDGMLFGVQSELSPDLYRYRVINGNLVFQAMHLNFTRVLKTGINDGLWHHLVVSNGLIVLDGRTVFNRSFDFSGGQPGNYGTIGARINNIGADANGNDTLTVDLMTFVWRAAWNLSENGAKALYDEFAETTLVSAEPMRLSLAAADAVAEGNTKKILVFWGLEWQDNNGYTPASTGSGIPGTGRSIPFIYGSAYSGFSVDKNGAMDQFSGMFSNELQRKDPFVWNGYMVVPVNLLSPELTSRGLLKDEVFSDPWRQYGRFIDQDTGAERPLDIEKDLAVPLTEFDVVTVINYPHMNMAGRYKDGSSYFSNVITSEYVYDQWRDKLRDDIFDAVKDGANLWITEPEMAVHFGVIQNYVIHSSNVEMINNPRGRAQDVAHGAQDNALVAYSDAWDGINKRRVVNAHEGITDVESYELVAGMFYRRDNVFQEHSTAAAYDVLKRPNGYLPNDTFYMWSMDIHERMGNIEGLSQPDASGGISQRIVTVPTVIAAAPDGIVGKVIAREQLTYFQGTIERENPYKEYATTIVVEPATVLNGEEIAGRVFVEFMDNMGINGMRYVFWHDEAGKQYWDGQYSPLLATTWDYDTRRNEETFYYFNSVKVLETGMRVEKSIPMTSSAGGPPVYGAGSLTWQMRGLLWLMDDVGGDIGEGGVRINAEPIEMTLTTPDATVAVQKHNTVSTAPMRMAMALMKPEGIVEPDVEVRVLLPMEMQLVMNDRVPFIPGARMEMTITMPEPTVVGGGEDAIVFMNLPEITLYMKEE